MARSRRERRRDPRYEYRAELEYRPSGSHAAQALNLCEQGMAFEGDAPLDEGTAVELFLVNGNVQINGVVRHCVSVHNGRYRIGVKFEKPERELVQVLTAAWKAGHE